MRAVGPLPARRGRRVRCRAQLGDISWAGSVYRARGRGRPGCHRYPAHSRCHWPYLFFFCHQLGPRRVGRSVQYIKKRGIGMECYSRLADTLAHHIRDLGRSHWPEPRGATENGSSPVE